jgi:hypothetical protein
MFVSRGCRGGWTRTPPHYLNSFLAVLNQTYSTKSNLIKNKNIIIKNIIIKKTKKNGELFNSPPKNS